MRAATAIAALLAVVVFGFIAYSLAVGSFSEEGSVLFSLVWGRMTLVDLYAGFTLFSGWVIFREGSKLNALVFVVLVMSLGNAFAAAYVLVALLRSRGSWSRFWMGHRSLVPGD